MSITQSKAEAAAQRRWLAGVGRQAPTAMFWAVCAPLIEGVFMIVQAWFLANTLDQAIRLQVPPTELWPSMLIIAGLIMLRAAINWSGERAASHASETIKQQIRRQLFGALLVKGPAWSKQHPVGQLTVALVDQVQALDGYLQRYLPSLIAAVILPLAIAVVVLPVDWIVTLLFLISAPVIPFFMALIGMRAEAANQKHQKVLSRLSGVFSDRIRGLFTLSLLGRTADEVESVRSASTGLSQTTMKVLRIAFLSSAVLELFAALGVAGVAVYIGLSYLGLLGSYFTGFTLQHGLFCLLLAPEVYNPLRKLAANYHDRATAKAAVHELQQLYGQLPQLSADLPLQQSSPVVQFYEQQVDYLVQAQRFTVYTPTGTELIHNIDFTLERGQQVALMGASGLGKTTFLETVMGLRPHAKGQVRFSCRPDQVVLIGPQPFIGLGTIADFLRVVQPNASDEQLWQALEQAQAAQFVSEQPDGLMTQLGTRGHGVSGGQAHRLALARLFLTDPEVILLDEPTAHLDSETRDAVLHAILQFAQQRCLILATHDEQVATQLQQVWYLQNQRLEQRGQA